MAIQDTLAQLIGGRGRASQGSAKAPGSLKTDPAASGATPYGIQEFQNSGYNLLRPNVIGFGGATRSWNA